MRVRKPESGRDWSELARLPALAAVLDPADADGAKNLAIDRVHKAAVGRAIGTMDGLDVMDFGCGTGRLSEWLAEEGARVTGVDATSEMLDVARVRVPGARFVESDGARLPFGDETFDVVVTAYVLQYYVRDAQTPELPELSRVLRPGGCLVSIEQVAARDIGRGGRVDDYERFFRASGLSPVSARPVRLDSSAAIKAAARLPRLRALPGYAAVVGTEALLGARRRLTSGYVDYLFVAERRSV